MHDMLNSSKTIAAFVVMLLGAGTWIGRVTAQLERKPPVQIKLPEHLQSELNACRALAYVVDQRRQREQGKP